MRRKTKHNKDGSSERMDESVQKSCWGLTAKAVIGIAGIILLAWLVTGGEAATVIATTQ
jgi:hypothetical protein